MLTKEELKKIAKEANIIFSEDEIEINIHKFNEVIDFVDIVKNASSNASPYRHKITPLEELREDVVEESISPDLAFSNASSAEDGFFVVKRRRRNE